MLNTTGDDGMHENEWISQNMSRAEHPQFNTSNYNQHMQHTAETLGALRELLFTEKYT